MSAVHPSRKAYVEDADEEMLDLASVPIDRDYAIPSTARAGIAPEKASAIIEQMDRKKKAAAIIVPTDDGRVRTRLRELGEPVTLFGEGPADRRDRLRELLYLRQEGLDADAMDLDMRDTSATPAAEEAEDEEEFYTPGEPELLEARKEIAKYSLPRAKERIQHQIANHKIPLQKHIKHRRALKEDLAKFEILGSQIAGERPMSLARFSPDGNLIAAGNWSGTMRLLSTPKLEEKKVFRGHTDRVGGISWHPSSTTSLSEDLANLASGGAEGNIHLWSLTNDKPISTLSGHSGRVARVEYHPCGKYLASASFDTTWRLWDLETQKELLLQEGHSREVYTVAFQGDGALIASGGYDSIGRVWDIRTGRTIMILDGHIREITGLSWHPDGYRVASSSGDASVKIWDVRMVQCVATIGAHKNLVSDVRFFNGPRSAVGELNTSGTYFVTSGFDDEARIYSSDDWAFVKSLGAHTGKVSSVDVSLDGRYIVTSGHDRTVKLWAREDIEL
ncbi:WD40 repeat-like protein [Ascodesmis nigricans]|uniref:WD40 repeat-like protein n=1 Tax=Ascodesmis nigricans TaxID=341454 RepID=A0A4S2N8R2_9PEZI|nr:WD40 repeat-like protein [Ascodesmis nigricans]